MNYSASRGTEMHACGCVGPQNGQPLCPCMMRNISIVDGHYVKVTDYGPVVHVPREPTRAERIAELEAELAKLRGRKPAPEK